MPKLNVIPDRDSINMMVVDDPLIPAKIKVCKCKQCKYVKHKRKNRKYSKLIKRMMNKQARRMNMDGKYITHYWA